MVDVARLNTLAAKECNAQKVNSKCSRRNNDLVMGMEVLCKRSLEIEGQTCELLSRGRVCF